MKLNEFIAEDGRIVPGVNTTVDVKPGETERQAKKFFGGDGKPKHLGVPGATPNQAFNLGMVNENMSHTAKKVRDTERKKNVKPGTEEWFKLWFSLPYLKESFEVVLEGYKLQLERDDDMYVLHITDNETGKRTEVRGKSGYESGNYDPDDPLHQLLDKIGKASNISELINGEVVGINPKHPDGASAKAHADQAFNENEPGSLAHKINWGGQNKQQQTKQPKQQNAKNSWWQSLKQRVMGEEALDEKWSKKYKRSIDCDNPKGFSQKAHCAGRKKNEDIEENFADGKKKGKSRPGRVKRAGASCNGSVTELRRKAKKYSGERGKMYHWCANMKAGKKK